MTAPGEYPGYSVWRGAIHKNAGLCQHRPYSYVSRFAIVNKMGQVPISNTTLHRTGLFDGYVDELNITNSTLDEIVGENFRADTVVWDSVTLDGKVDLTNAHINDFRPTHIKRGPKLNLMTTGSNIKF